MRHRPLLLAAALTAVGSGLAPAPAAADYYDVTSECTYAYKSIASSTTQVLVAVVAEAHAEGVQPALTTTVTCTVRNAYRESFVTTGNMLGPHVYWSGSAMFRWDTPEVCSESSAVFLLPSGATFTVTEDVTCKPVGP